MSFHGARLKFNRYRHQAYGNRGSSPSSQIIGGTSSPPPQSAPLNQPQPQQRPAAGYQPAKPGTPYGPDTRDTQAAPGVRNVRPQYQNLPNQPSLNGKADFSPSMAGRPMSYGPSESAPERYEQMADQWLGRKPPVPQKTPASPQPAPAAPAPSNPAAIPAATAVSGMSMGAANSAPASNAPATVPARPSGPPSPFTPDARDQVRDDGVRAVRPAYRNLPNQPDLSARADFSPSMAGKEMSYGPAKDAAPRYEAMANGLIARKSAARDAVTARHNAQIADPVGTVDAARQVRDAALAKDGITDLGGGAKSLSNARGTGFAGTGPATGPGRIYDDGKLVDMAASRAANSIIHTNTPAPTSAELKQNIANETARLAQGAPERLAQDRKQEIDAYRINTSAERAGMVRQQSEQRAKDQAEAEFRALPSSVQSIMNAARVPTDGTSMYTATTTPANMPAGPIGAGTMLARPDAPSAPSSPANTAAAVAVANTTQNPQPGSAPINSASTAASTIPQPPSSPENTTGAAAVAAKAPQPMPGMTPPPAPAPGASEDTPDDSALKPGAFPNPAKNSPAQRVMPLPNARPSKGIPLQSRR